MLYVSERPVKLVIPVVICLGLGILFPISALASEGTGQWTIDSFTAAVVKEGSICRQAQESLQTAILDEKMSMPFYDASLSVAGGWNNRSLPHEDNDSERVTITAPITEKLSASASYTVGKTACDIKLSYVPLSKSTVLDMASGFPSWLLGSTHSSDSATSRRELAELRLADAEAAARLEARKAYINALKAIKVRSVAEEECRLAQTELTIAQRRYQLGLSSESEVAQAKSNLLDTEISLMKSKTDEYWIRKRLSQLVGQDMSDAVLDDLPDFALEVPDAEKLISAAAKADVGLAQAIAELDSATRDLELAKSLVPTVQIDAEIDTENWSPQFTAGANWSISLSRPIEIQEAEIRVGQRRRAVDDRNNAIQDLVTKNIDYLRIEIASMEKWHMQLADLEKSYNESLKSYDRGEILLVELDRARLNLQKARDSYLAHWGSVWETWYSLACTNANQ